MNSTAERIEMINSFELIGRNRNEKVDMHLQSNFYILLLSCITFSVAIILISLAVISSIFEIENRFIWSKMSLILLISINFYKAIGVTLYKKLILKHLKFLETSNTHFFDQQLNDELANIVSKLNKPLKNNITLAVLAVIILIGAITNIILDRQFQYYNLFIIPTMLFYILASLNILKTYNKIKVNINKIELATKVSFNTN